VGRTSCAMRGRDRAALDPGIRLQGEFSGADVTERIRHQMRIPGIYLNGFAEQGLDDGAKQKERLICGLYTANRPDDSS
jgi:hypothetical protein